MKEYCEDRSEIFRSFRRMAVNKKEMANYDNNYYKSSPISLSRILNFFQIEQMILKLFISMFDIHTYKKKKTMKRIYINFIKYQLRIIVLNLQLNITNYRLRASKFETSFEINPPFYPFTINKIYIKRRERYKIDEKYSLEGIESKLVNPL